MMRHYCCDCKHLFPENEMILHEYHDGNDWYCKPCYDRMSKMVASMNEKFEKWEREQHD